MNVSIPPAKKIIITALVVLSCLTSLSAQSAKKLDSTIKEYMSAVKNETDKPDVSEIFQREKNLKPVLNSLKEFHADSTYKVRLEAYKLTYKLGLISTELETRQAAVSALVGGVRDKNRSIQGWSVQHISVYNREDFTSETKGQITQAISTNPQNLPELIKVAGYLNIPEAKGGIENIALTSSNTSDKLAAYLALARMGQADYSAKTTSIIRRQALNNNVVYELVPALIYTRQKQCIDYAIEILYVDEKNCGSSNPDNPTKILCAYRVMEYLAPVIKDFPFGLKTSGDIDADNYKTALIETREWFLKMGSTYEIIDNSF